MKKQPTPLLLKLILIPFRIQGRLPLMTMIGITLVFIGRAGAFSISGTASTMGRGYQDYYGEDHFDVAQGLKLNARQFGLDGLSLHGYFQYFGDAQDNFTESSTFRLYHGYLKYDRNGSPLTLRGGRFFLFRGVAVGVLDGGEATYRLSPKLAITAFGGQQGPLSREWEVDRQGDSPWFGGEVRWDSGKILGIKPTFALSYTRQERDENLLRHLAGLSIGFRVNRRWSSLNVLHLNLEGSSLRKALTRWRYVTPKMQMSFEGAVLQPYVAAYSYFNDFEAEDLIQRAKYTVEYHFKPRKWGAGLSSMVFGTSEYSLRLGPYLIFPLGRIGYSHSAGDQPNKQVYWGYFRWNPRSFLDLYAYAANMEYEWEALLSETVETTSLMAGFTLRPPFLKRTEWGLEWQNYRTPRFEADRRFIANLQWNFDLVGN